MSKSLQCCVNGCRLRKREAPAGTAFHRFPSDIEVCRKWLKNVGDEELCHLPVGFLTKSRYVCSRHFTPDSFRSGSHILKAGSVPLCENVEPLADTDIASSHFGRVQDDNGTSRHSTVTEEISVHTAADTLVTEPEVTAGDEGSSQLEANGPNICLEVPETTQLVCSSGGPSSRRKVILSAQNLISEEPSPALPIEDTPDDSQRTLKRKTKTGVTARQSKRRRLAQLGSADDITPAKTKLFRVLARKETVLRQKCEELQQAKDGLRSLHEDDNLAAFLKDLVSPGMLQLLSSNLRNHLRKPEGRTWTLEEKLLALSIYKRSPRAYHFLQYIIQLPTPRSIVALLNRIPMEPGLCDTVLSQLSKKAEAMSPRNKLVAVLFGEISLKKRLNYNEDLDCVEGFADHGAHGRTSDLADKALVFLIQGIRKKYKQPVAFYFSSHGVSADRLSVLITEFIRAVRCAGFTPVLTVSDQGGANQGALNLLQAEPHEQKGPWFFVDGIRVVHVWDVPHLFKKFWTNWFSAGKLVVRVPVASGRNSCRYVGDYQHIIRLFELDRKIFRMGRLTEANVFPEGKHSRKVSNAARVISKRTAAQLYSIHLHSKGKIIPKCFETAYVTELLDDLFDAVNGPAGPHDAKPGRKNVSEKSGHPERWSRFRRILQDSQFVNKDGKRTSTRCLAGMVHTLQALQVIWQLVSEEHDFRFLNLRLLNQDSLENLFSAIRSMCATFQSPTCSLFASNLKTCIVTKLSSPGRKGANCEEDSLVLLDDLKRILTSTSFDVETPQKEAVVAPADIPVLHLDENLSDDDMSSVLQLLEDADHSPEDSELIMVENLPASYVAGYLAQRVLKRASCSDCSDLLKTDNVTGEHTFIELREWADKKRSFTYPSRNLCKLVEDARNCFLTDIVPSFHEKMLKSRTVTALTTSCDSTWFTCNEHRKEMFKVLFNVLSRLLIHTQCRRNNECLVQESQKAAENRQKDHFRGR